MKDSGLLYINKAEKKILYNIKRFLFTKQIYSKTKPGTFLSKELVINNLNIDLTKINN